MTKSNFRYAERILVYTTIETDTQGSVARTKYKQQGQFLVFLYFNDAGVEACKEMGILLRILDRIDESELPSRRATVVERPYLAPGPKQAAFLKKREIKTLRLPRREIREV